MMKTLYKAFLVAIATTATASAMAQTTNNKMATDKVAANDSTEATFHRGGFGPKIITCPSCGYEIALNKHHGMRHGKHHGKPDEMHADKPKGFNKNAKGNGHAHHGFKGDKRHGNRPALTPPEMGTVTDTLPHGAKSFVKDGKQIFNAWGVEYEPTIDNGTIKYKVTGTPKME
ncbi:MAG: hypothetical protein MJZ13_10225 [Bacteroidales bacterium]|nr:hypothetical protein [Bacteroidales bacterium]